MNKMLERLEDSDRQQRSFNGDVSHELRSPLTGVRAQLEVHQAHPNTADWREVAGEVLEEVTRMEQLIGDMLLLATVDSGQTQIYRRVRLGVRFHRLKAFRFCSG